MARCWTRIALAALVTGCAGQAPSTGGGEGKTVANRLSVRTAALAGVAQAPASVVSNAGGQVVSNGGGTLVSNNSGGVVSNGGASFHLAAVEPWKAVPGAPVTVLDVEEQAIAGVKPVTTDASGRFSVADVPTGSVVTVQVKVGDVMLTSLAQADGSKVQVDPASTLATAELRVLYKDNPGALARASLTGFTALAAAVQEVLAKEEVELKLDSPAALELTFQAVVARRPELAAQVKALAPAASSAKGGEGLPENVATLAPLATPTPTPGVSPTPGTPGSPTPQPEATGTAASPTPTPVPLATKTPTPSGLAAKQLLQTTNACPACDLDGLDLTGVNAPDADLRDANLQAVKADGINLSGAKLVGALFRLAKLKGADLSGADLTNADLTGADLTDANLTYAKLTGAILDSANLAGAHLNGANLTGANAGFANFSGATLTDATLTGLLLGGATWTDSHHCADGSVGGCN